MHATGTAVTQKTHISPACSHRAAIRPLPLPGNLVAEGSLSSRPWRGRKRRGGRGRGRGRRRRRWACELEAPSPSPSPVPRRLESAGGYDQETNDVKVRRAKDGDWQITITASHTSVASSPYHTFRNNAYYIQVIHMHYKATTVQIVA